jgi:hypothetical protein
MIPLSTQVIFITVIAVEFAVAAVPTKAANYPNEMIGAWGGRAAYFGDDNPTVARKACDSYRKNPRGVTGDVLVFRGSKKFSYGGYMSYVDTNASVKQLAPDKWQITDRHYDKGEGDHRVMMKEKEITE